MKTILLTCLLSLAALATNLQALEMSAGQAHQSSVSSNAYQKMNSKILSKLMGELESLKGEMAKLKICQNQKKLYAPDNVDADANGCVEVNTTTIVQNEVVQEEDTGPQRYQCPFISSNCSSSHSTSPADWGTCRANITTATTCWYGVREGGNDNERCERRTAQCTPI